jgi:hypothetical protein
MLLPSIGIQKGASANDADRSILLNLWGVSLLTAHLKRCQSKLTQARAKVGADSSSCLDSHPTFMTLPAAKHQADPAQWRIDRAVLLPLANLEI